MRERVVEVDANAPVGAAHDVLMHCYCLLPLCCVFVELVCLHRAPMLDV